MCLCGDFNSIRSVEERKSRGTVLRQHDVDIFHNFIEDSFLVVFPVCGRLFTWYRGDGHSMRRLDRFLLNDFWCTTWPNCTQIALQRGLSDHVTLV
ncbi:endonuclease/exonuclease/phosphatase family protein [Medicago truncatula]|uniref:Endonuclease/exonuclease/phosphatase family protein n=1 Tax=Medicago truncatula TaxID=3880 RepID=A0A072TQG4_MEDTR|nr:endonuclease/exonuclease/phosphatase family protein [Medicago truncatula]